MPKCKLNLSSSILFSLQNHLCHHQRHINRYYSIRSNNKAYGLWKQMTLYIKTQEWSMHTRFSSVVWKYSCMVYWIFDDSMIWYKNVKAMYSRSVDYITFFIRQSKHITVTVNTCLSGDVFKNRSYIFMIKLPDYINNCIREFQIWFELL